MRASLAHASRSRTFPSTEGLDPWSRSSSSITRVSRTGLSVGSILVGPYHSAATWDRHWGDTFGSGDPIFDATNELRFAKTSGLLVSCRVGVPERPTDSDAYLASIGRLPVRRALLRLPPGTNFQFPPATHTEIDDGGTGLVVYRGRPDEVRIRVEVCPTFEILLGDQQICGFMLHDPSDHLVRSWRVASPPVANRALATLLARYVRMIDSDFVEQLEDAPAEACGTLAHFRAEVAALAPSAQRDALIQRISDVQGIFWRVATRVHHHPPIHHLRTQRARRAPRSSSANSPSPLRRRP